MKADWVAASVRSRSMAKRRIGAGAAREIAAQRSLADGLARLADTVYADRVIGCTTLDAAERATRDTTLWQLRVLAGWMPATGTRLARTAAAAYERDNVLALGRSFDDGRPTAAPFDLGSLGTAWSRLRSATSTEELQESLRRSPWGDLGPGRPAGMRDVLTLVWLGRLAEVAGAARPWAEAAAALIVARILLVDGVEPSPRIRQLVRPLLGAGWETARELAALRAVVPRAANAVFEAVTSPEDLWLAEARLRTRVEADGFRLLRGALPGPDAVLGGMAVLGMDAWRVRAALAAAAAGSGTSEVLDAVA